MSLPNEVISSFLGAGGGQQYRIEKSVRLRASASGYFSKLSKALITPADTSYYKKTYSAWVKRGAISSIQHIITNCYNADNRWQINFNSSDQIVIFGNNAGTFILNLITTAVFRDTSAWYHIVVTVDTTLATATDRIKLYVNGVLQTLNGTVAPLNSQNVAALFIAPTTANTIWDNRIGNDFANGEGVQQFDGYIAELNAIDGQALPASSFGEYDLATGVWKPKRYQGSYGNNGFRLNFNTASLSTELQLSATASVGAPGLASGSSADFAKAIDTSVVSTNVTTGSNFDVIKYDLGSVQQITRFFAGGLYFSGASTTNSRILYSEDDVTYKVAQALAVNTTSTNFSGNLNVKARYVKINIDGFGTNGRGFIESLILYQDGIGLDASGNGNNFTPTNISVTSGITYDSMFDVPTPYADGNNGRGNYATWNPLNYDKGTGNPGTGRLLTGGNLNLAYAYSTWAGYRSTIAVSSGKWYVEMTCTAGGHGGYNTSLDALPTSQALSSAAPIEIAPTSGDDVLAIALNLDAGTWATYRKNLPVANGTTTAGAEYIFRVTAGNGVNTFTNFGQRPFTYTPPAGHKALHTGNLPIPTIGATNATQARSYFNAYTYTGTGSKFLKYGSLPKRDRKDSSTVSKSLRFRNTSYLTRAALAGATPTKWGMSFWVKPTTGGAIYSSGAIQNAVYETYAALRVYTDQINIWDRTNSNNNPLNIVAKYNFNSDNWYHIVVSCDTTLAAEADRVKIYVNGKRLTNFTTVTYYSQNYATRFNSSLTRYIGRLPPDGYANAAYSHFNGYLADFHFIDGNSIVPESFGQYNIDNIWVPLSYQGIYGPAGWRLTFGDATSTTTLCYDESGNLNNWTPSGISVASNASYDSMTDSPCDYDDGSGIRGNFATLSQYPSDTATITDALLTFDTGAAGAVFGNFNLTSGKWYWEVTPTSASTAAQRYVGIICDGLLLYYRLNGTKEINGVNTSYGSAYTTGSIIGVALDIDAKTVTFYKDSVNQGPISFTQTGQFTCVSQSGGNAASTGYYNFGQRPFSYTPPTGYKSINTYNFTKASTFWWGDGTGSIPDLLWIKNRTLAGSANRLADSVRGFGLALTSNSGEIETPVGIGRVDKFGIGFDGNSTNVNGATQSHALWAWKAGSISTNTSGSITSTVSVNQSAGFSIVNYIGNATTATVGHGLGVAPSFIIVKGRTNSVDWQTYHVSLGINYTTYLNLTNASNNIANYWGASNPTSTTFGIISSYSGVNTSGVNYIAYCWAAVPGYSKFGSYTGNGSADGTFVYCGFRPRFIMFKSTSVAGNWFIRDTSRNTYNAATQSLYPSLTDTEFTGGALDILSNGFKARAATSGLNGSGETIIYAAFAESPFKYSLAR